jgi:hypothetical protein
MAVTNIRVILVHRGLIYGRKYLEVPIVKIKSVSYKTGLFFGTIFIDTGAGTVILDTVNKKCAAEITSILGETIGESVNHPTVAQSSAVLNQLERLAVLLDKGILTEVEFLAQKEKILSISDSASGAPEKSFRSRQKLETLPKEPSPSRGRALEVRNEPRALEVRSPDSKAQEAKTQEPRALETSDPSSKIKPTPNRLGPNRPNPRTDNPPSKNWVNRA